MKRLLTMAALVAMASASQANLLAYFELNEASGNAADSSGNGDQTQATAFGTGLTYNQASVTAGTYGAITISAGQAAAFGTSIDFGNDRTYILGNFNVIGAGRSAIDALLAPGTGGAKVAGAMTTMAWVDLDSLDDRQSIFTSSDSGGWRFGTDGSQLIFTTLNSEDFFMAAGLSAGQWYHMAAAVQSDTISYNLNGNLLGVQPLGSPYTEDSDSGAARLGGFRAGVENMFGRMDDVKIYSTALDANAIAAAALPISPVPEPGSALMSTAGLVLIGTWLNRQRRRTGQARAT